MVFMGAFLTFAANFTVVASFVMRLRPVYYRDRAARMYRPWTYAAAMAAAEAPYVLASTLLFVAVFYPMLGLDLTVAGPVFWFFACYLVFAVMGTCLGHAFAAAMPSAAVASAVASLVTMFFSMFAGFSIPEASIP